MQSGGPGTAPGQLGARGVGADLPRLVLCWVGGMEGHTCMQTEALEIGTPAARETVTEAGLTGILQRKPSQGDAPQGQYQGMWRLGPAKLPKSCTPFSGPNEKNNALGCDVGPGLRSRKLSVHTSQGPPQPPCLGQRGRGALPVF